MIVPRPGVQPLSINASMRSFSSTNTASATGAPGIITADNALPLSLVLELPLAREHHHNPVFIGGCDDFVVPQRPTRLDDGSDAGRSHCVESVAEREEGIAGCCATFGPTGCLLHGQLARVHAVLLSPAN